MPIGQIPLSQLALIFIPVAAVIVIQWRWSLNYLSLIHI